MLAVGGDDAQGYRPWLTLPVVTDEGGSNLLGAYVLEGADHSGRLGGSARTACTARGAHVDENPG